MTRRPVVPVLLLIVLLLASCAPLRQNIIGAPVSRDFADSLMQGWYESAAGVVSMRGLARVKVKSAEDTLAGSQVLIAEKPNRLRAETLSPFGSSLLLLAVNGEDLEVSIPSRNIFYSGVATSANIGRFVRIPLKLPDLVSVLLYQPPMIEALGEEAFELEGEGWLLVRSNLQNRQELTFNLDRRLVGVSYFERNRLLLKIEYEQFAEQEEPFPHFFGIELPAQKTTASLEFSTMETNAVLPAGIFRLSAPPGATIVPLDQQ